MDRRSRLRMLLDQWRSFAVVGAVTTFVMLAVLPSCIVVQGRTGDRIIFSVDTHQEFMNDCLLCHAEINTDDVTADTRRAVERRCLSCHNEEAENCNYCHTDVDNAGIFPSKERHLTFSHATHDERVYGDCSMCHPDVHESHHGEGDEELVSMPAHNECFQCHEMEEFYDQMECRNCHESMFEYGLAPFQDFAHGPGWLETRHGEFVRNRENAETCNQCHEPAYCDSCHAGEPLMTLFARLDSSPTRSFIHPGDYVYRHMWDARSDPASCMRCHKQTFCSDCHDARGISEPAARNRSDGFRFHGPGVLTPGSPDFHGSAARRDILSCAACHTQSTSGNCADCHASGAFGGNPHPPNFKSKLSRTGAPVCRICHVR